MDRLIMTIVVEITSIKDHMDQWVFALLSRDHRRFLSTTITVRGSLNG